MPELWGFRALLPTPEGARAQGWAVTGRRAETPAEGETAPTSALDCLL